MAFSLITLLTYDCNTSLLTTCTESFFSILFWPILSDLERILLNGLLRPRFEVIIGIFKLSWQSALDAYISTSHVDDKGTRHGCTTMVFFCTQVEMGGFVV